jgi:hypothetical protein
MAGVPYTKNAFLVVDVIHMDGKMDPFSVVSLGYSLIPIFAEANYVRSGAFQVPIIQGPVNRVRFVSIPLPSSIPHFRQTEHCNGEWEKNID